MRINGTDISVFGAEFWRYERVLPEISNGTGFINGTLSPVWYRPDISMPIWRITLRVKGDTRYECERAARIILSKFYQNEKNEIMLDDIMENRNWTPSRRIVGSLVGSNYSEFIKRHSHRLTLEIAGYETGKNDVFEAMSNEMNDERAFEEGEIVDLDLRTLTFQEITGSYANAPIKLQFVFYVSNEEQIVMGDRMAHVALTVTNRSSVPNVFHGANGEPDSEMNLELDFEVDDGYYLVTIDTQSGEFSVRRNCRPAFGEEEYKLVETNYKPGENLVKCLKTKEVPCIKPGRTDITVSVKTQQVMGFEFNGSMVYEVSDDTYSRYGSDGKIILGTCRLYMVHGFFTCEPILL